MANTAMQSFDGAIDRGHLDRMTFGDRGLERELLELFDRQCAMLMVRMRAGGDDAVAPLAHTIKGSAAGVGAIRVARAADVAEMSTAGDVSAAVDRLAQAVDEARALIAVLLKQA
ncbi:MAG: Hpt domain-containing protein [Pseudolabrys sp.]